MRIARNIYVQTSNAHLSELLAVCASCTNIVNTSRVLPQMMPDVDWSLSQLVDEEKVTVTL